MSESEKRRAEVDEWYYSGCKGKPPAGLVAVAVEEKEQEERILAASPPVVERGSDA